MCLCKVSGHSDPILYVCSICSFCPFKFCVLVVLPPVIDLSRAFKSVHIFGATLPPT